MQESTCPHLDEQCVLEAVTKVQILSTSKLTQNGSYYPYCCITCGFIGALESLKGTLCIRGRHPACVRYVDPIEIYCFTCRDFQFSSRFDSLVGRKRCYRTKAKIKLPTLQEYQEQQATNSIKMKGMVNLGATCFMSSVLQILLHNPLVTSSKHLKFSSEECLSLTKIDTDTRMSTASNARSSKADKSSMGAPICPGCIACEFMTLLKELRTDVDAPLVPSNLLYAVWNYADYMSGYSQQDAHEFLIAFIDGLDVHLIENHDAKQSSPQAKNVSPSLTSLFRGISDGSVSSGGGGGGFLSPAALSSSGLAPLINGSSASSSSSSSIAIGIPSSSSLSPGGSPRIRPSYSPRGSTYTFSNVNASNTFLTSNRIAEIFAGTIQSTVICQECGNKSLTFEAFLDLSLSIDNGSGEEGGDESNSHQHHSHKRSRSASLATLTSDTFSDDTGNVTPSGQSSGAAATSNGGLNSPTAGSKPAITVADCLRHYTSIENLTEKIKCDLCKDYQPCHKQLSISTVPQVLLLHLKRFDMLTERKITTKVEFDLKNFDISPFISSSSSNSSSGSNGGNLISGGNGSHSINVGVKPLLYDLQGIVSHSGSLNQGHYVSYVLDQAQNQWLRCDDETVTLVSEEEVSKVEAYILFYSKQRRTR